MNTPAFSLGSIWVTAQRKGPRQSPGGLAELKNQSWDSREAQAPRVHRTEHQRGKSCPDNTLRISRETFLSVQLSSEDLVQGGRQKHPEGAQRTAPGTHVGPGIGHVPPARAGKFKNQNTVMS